jgi:chaperonin cofactor prefoldin
MCAGFRAGEILTVTGGLRRARVDLAWGMILNQSHQWLLVLLVGTSVLLSGCGKADQSSGASADPKAEIRKILFKQTGQKQFTPGLDLNLPARVATLRSNATSMERRTIALRTALQTAGEDSTPAGKQMRASLEAQLQEADRAWEAARIEAARKQQELSQQEDTYIRSVRQEMTSMRSYDAVYRLIGQQLATADGLLADPDPARRRMGLKIAREACGHANSVGMDVGLAARICEAYFWPNLSLADTEPGSRERALDLLETSRRVFFETDETNNVLKNYSLLMSNAPNVQAADTFRVQLADWLEERGSLKRAAEILNEIRDAEVLASAQERIARVRERAAGTP